ncbi:hypothetical protein BJ912DRAFT_1043415 [Pholiota molesta]|nr:hypothetical protein BJ912DRAFT_1043415 [Pholiota molesta]
MSRGLPTNRPWPASGSALESMNLIETAGSGYNVKQRTSRRSTRGEVKMQRKRSRELLQDTPERAWDEMHQLMRRRMGSSEGAMRVEREQDVAIRDYPALSDACGAAASRTYAVRPTSLRNHAKIQLDGLAPIHALLRAVLLNYTVPTLLRVFFNWPNASVALAYLVTASTLISSGLTRSGACDAAKGFAHLFSRERRAIGSMASRDELLRVLFWPDSTKLL